MTKRSAGAAFFAGTLLLAGLAIAEPDDIARGLEPSVGVPYQPREGFFAETQLGVFTALGGRKTFSNAQPYVALSIGKDFGSIAPGLSLFFTVAHAYNAGSCRQTTDAGACQTYKLPDGSSYGSPDSFSVIPIELGGRYRFKQLIPRLGLYGGLVGGISLLTPRIFEDAPPMTPHAGLSTGIEYVTRLEGLTVGAEVLVRVGFAPVLPSLAFSPRIQYVF